MRESSNTFRAFIPLNLVKGKDENGVSKMRFEGIASTASQDADGEFIDPNGLDTDYFLKYGFMNWNHQTSKDPLALIGRPTDAVKKAEGLFIGCELFDNSPRAKEVYALGEILEAQGGKLGFSIEGKVTERDKKNPKIVKKAKITGCAITPNPKNIDTVAEIIKGHNFENISAYEEEDEETREKALTAGSASGAAISKESLDNRVKVLTYGDHNDDTKKKLSKSEVMAQIIDRNPEIDLETGEELFKLISRIEKSIIMSKPEIKISPEAIEKAYETLGLNKEGRKPSEEASPAKGAEEDSEIDEVEKGYKEMSKMMDGQDYKKMSKEDKDALKKKMSDTLKKMEDDDVEDSDDDDEEEGDDDEAEKANKVKKSISSEAIAAATEILTAAGLNITIGKVEIPASKEIEKGEKDELGAAKKDSVIDLIKGHMDQLEEAYEEKFDAAVTLIKGLSDEIEILTEEVGRIGSQSPGPKSVTSSAAIEKSWDNDLEKGMPGADSGKPKLSVSRDKRVILDILEKSYFNEDQTQLVNKKLSQEAMQFESANTITKGITDELTKQGYELVG